jgi:hypothetical protein
MERVIKILKQHYKYTDKNIEKQLEQFKKHPDILNEFLEVYGLDYPIEVEGLTARNLYENFNLSLLGAYNYLIYLREEPEEAKKDLKNVQQRNQHY